MIVNGKKVLIFGTGISGIGAAKLSEKNGASVVLYDGNKDLKTEDIKGKLGEDFKGEIILGELPEAVIRSLDIAVLSPGVPTDLPVVDAMRDAGVLITGEVELAYSYAGGDVLAVTGTNGKTTTTSLLGEIMKAYRGDDVRVVGNIGFSYTLAAMDMDEHAIAVAELSSFQLETIIDFKPHVSAILNFTPDHLNRHYTMENYMNAKKNIAKNQSAQDFCILNYEDEETRKFGETLIPQVIYFSSLRELEQGIFLRDGNIIYKNPDEQIICHVDELQILGRHNHENVMAAVAMAAAYGVPVDVIRHSVLNFAGVEHRIEYVTTRNDVAYYNDSKGTNPDAAIKGIQAMNRPTILLGGGYDKQSDYTEWIQAFDGKVKKLILLGQTKEKIAKTCDELGFKDYVLVDTFEEAVELAMNLAVPGDAVLLSPACASWGMFPNYEVRGRYFKELVTK